MPPAARLGDPHTCPHSSGGTIIEGAATVFINGKPAARIGDTTCHHGVISQGSANVIVGGGGGPAGAMGTARSNGAPFVRP